MRTKLVSIVNEFVGSSHAGGARLHYHWERFTMYSMKLQTILDINVDAFSCFQLFCQLVSHHSDDPSGYNTAAVQSSRHTDKPRDGPRLTGMEAAMAMGTVKEARAVRLYWTAGAMMTTPRVCSRGHSTWSMPPSPTTVTQKHSSEKKKSVNCSTSYLVRQ